MLESYLNIYDASLSKDEWFEKTKQMAESLGYITNMKEYKQNPDMYKGSIAHVTGFIRVAITNKQNTPDIYSIMQVLGETKTKERIKNAILNS